MTSTQPPPAHAPTWAQSLRAYLEPASLRMLALGFSAGLPLLLVLGTLGFRLREAGIDRSTIGFLGWVGLVYGFKWVWAPLVDRVPIPWLTARMGRRRSWLLAAQLLIMAGLAGMALQNPLQPDGVRTLAQLALLVAFASATQDIALDAFRIESAGVQQQAVLAACYQTGYRLAMICAGAGVLRLAAWAQASSDAGSSAYYNAGWTTGYLAMAAAMLVGVATVLLSREPQQARCGAEGAGASDAVYEQALAHVAQHGVPWAALAACALWLGSVALAVAQAAKAQWAQGSSAWTLAALVLLAAASSALAAGRRGPCLRAAPGSALHRLLARAQASFVAPFADFFARYRWHALLILALIGSYRISDMVMGLMANPFYVDMQFSKDQVALVSGVLGVVFTLLGTFVGGVLAMRFGVMRILMLGALLAAGSNLLFAWLALLPHAAQDLWHISLWGKNWELPRALTAVIVADNLAGGMASAAFVAYLSGLTSLRYSATQYALFSSLMLLFPKFLAGFSGHFVDSLVQGGYSAPQAYATFFVGTAALGLPVLALVWWAARVLPARAPA